MRLEEEFKEYKKKINIKPNRKNIITAVIILGLGLLAVTALQKTGWIVVPGLGRIVGFTCGNGVCESDFGESCAICIEDCGECLTTTTIKRVYCGDSICSSSETCSSCPSDCGKCLTTTTMKRVYCGDDICGFGEDCKSCSTDCGECMIVGSLTSKWGTQISEDEFLFKDYEMIGSTGTKIPHVSAWISNGNTELRGITMKYTCETNVRGYYVSSCENAEFCGKGYDGVLCGNCDKTYLKARFTDFSGGIITNTGDYEAREIRYMPKNTKFKFTILFYPKDPVDEVDCTVHLFVEDPPFQKDLNFKMTYVGEWPPED